MWGHRMFGAVLALIGAAGLGGVLALFYLPGSAPEDFLIFMGLPGALIAALSGMAACVAGGWLLLAPGYAARHTRRLAARIRNRRTA